MFQKHDQLIINTSHTSPPPIRLVSSTHTDLCKRENVSCGCGRESYLQVVEDEKQCFCGQSLVELYGVRVERWYLMMEGQGGAWIPHQVLPGGQKQRGSSPPHANTEGSRRPPSRSCHPHLILSESEGCGMCVHADSCMACWYSWSLGRGVGPSGHTPSEGGMLTSDTDG